ncbi:hypothetical protein H0E87_024308 [Populus deltoides]|uniref:Uncharacterized protein n=1 Tax=Populus deltoides TaxID=3696 RepID=A0A8T2X785_POPDE|nr:hypothetical protein H0E87_024308 [Populus deltoides]
MAIGMQMRKTPNMAMAVLRRQCLGLQYGPPLMLHTFALKSPWAPSAPCPCSAPPPPIFDRNLPASSVMNSQRERVENEDDGLCFVIVVGIFPFQIPSKRGVLWTVELLEEAFGVS